MLGTGSIRPVVCGAIARTWARMMVRRLATVVESRSVARCTVMSGQRASMMSPRAAPSRLRTSRTHSSRLLVRRPRTGLPARSRIAGRPRTRIATLPGAGSAGVGSASRTASSPASVVPSGATSSVVPDGHGPSRVTSMPSGSPRRAALASRACHS